MNDKRELGTIEMKQEVAVAINGLMGKFYESLDDDDPIKKRMKEKVVQEDNKSTEREIAREKKITKNDSFNF